MKAFSLVLLSLAALLVLALFLFRGARTSPSSEDSTRGAAESSSAGAPPAAPLLAPAPASASADPARETAVPPGALDDSGAKSDLPPLADLASGVPPRAVENQRFEKKYGAVSTAGRKSARDAIDQYVRANRTGTEEILALSRELEWLDAHPSP